MGNKRILSSPRALGHFGNLASLIALGGEVRKVF
jgi:hypothetical protein